MTENEVATLVVDAAYRVHTALGPGLLESVYVAVLAHEVQKRGLPVLRQVPVQVRYDGLLFEEGFRADLIVADLLIVEVKSTETTIRSTKSSSSPISGSLGKGLGCSSTLACHS